MRSPSAVCHSLLLFRSVCAGCSQREISPGSGGLLWPRVDVGVRHSNHNAERRTLRVHEAPAGGAVRKSHLLVMIFTIRNLKITLCLIVSIETIHWYNDLITAVTGSHRFKILFTFLLFLPKPLIISLTLILSIANIDRYKNRITAVTGLPSLPHLSRLDLSRNAITTLEGMPTLPSLEELNVANNSLTR